MSKRKRKSRQNQVQLDPSGKPKLNENSAQHESELLSNNALVKLLEDRYPEEEHPEILEIIDRYELALEVLEHPQHYFKSEVEEFLKKTIKGKFEREQSKNI